MCLIEIEIPIITWTDRTLRYTNRDIDTNSHTHICISFDTHPLVWNGHLEILER